MWVDGWDSLVMPRIYCSDSRRLGWGWEKGKPCEFLVLRRVVVRIWDQLVEKSGWEEKRMSTKVVLSEKGPLKSGKRGTDRG